MNTSRTSFLMGTACGVVLCGALLVSLGAGQQAQPGTAPAPAKPIRPAGTDDAIALGKLNQLVGTWAVQGTSVSETGVSQGPFQGESQFGWTLGGNFLSGDHVLWNSQGAALQTVDVMGFTPGVGFTRSEITNGDRSMFLSSGMYDESADAIAFVTSNRLVTADGRDRSLATSFLFQPDGTVVWNTQFSVNDQPAGSVRLLLTRTSTTPGISSPQTPFGAPLMQQGSGATAGQSADQSTNFIVQTPQGMAVTRAPQTMQENQQLMAAMMKQRQQMQAQMNAMQSQVADMSRTMSGNQ